MHKNETLYDTLMIELHRDKELHSIIDRSFNKIKDYNYKLYRYYSLESSCALENIKNNIIYGADPREFNDPFDCNPGISVDELVKMALCHYYKTYIPGIRQKTMFEKAINVFSNMSDEKIKLFDTIVKNDMDYLQKCVELASLLGVAEEFETVDFEGIYKYIDEQQHELKNKLSKNIGISCFTTKCDNLLMWSHYANKHTGICVEYDFSSLFEVTNKAGLLLPVEYLNDRVCFPFEKTFRYSKNKVTKDTARKLLPDFIKMLLRKSEEWKYEEEWRLMIFLREEKERKIYFPHISKIILGCDFKTENHHLINSIARDKNITIEQAVLKRDKFGLELQKVQV